ncbi:MAG TPA: hypothetical protein GXZ21_00840 [Clostridiales bacterium]|nr:hypothetical protein [Clostridiales bacterium]
MNVKEYRLKGYSFVNFAEYQKAKQETDSIEYIRTHTDLTDTKKVAKLYNSLIEKETFKTVIGFEFLKELQNILIDGGIITLDTIPWIRVGRTNTGLSQAGDKREESMAREYKIRHRNSRIINIFLVLIIAAMIVIRLI